MPSGASNTIAVQCICTAKARRRSSLSSRTPRKVPWPISTKPSSRSTNRSTRPAAPGTRRDSGMRRPCRRVNQRHTATPTPHRGTAQASARRSPPAIDVPLTSITGHGDVGPACEPAREEHVVATIRTDRLPNHVRHHQVGVPRDRHHHWWRRRTRPTTRPWCRGRPLTPSAAPHARPDARPPPAGPPPERPHAPGPRARRTLPAPGPPAP